MAPYKEYQLELMVTHDLILFVKSTILLIGIRQPPNRLIYGSTNFTYGSNLALASKVQVLKIYIMQVAEQDCEI
jgi:hypothetical protein